MCAGGDLWMIPEWVRVRGEFGKRPHFFRVFFSHPSLTASVCRPWSTDVSNKAETTERGYIVPLDELTQQAGCLNEKVKAREVSTPTILTSWTRLPRSWSWPKRSKLWTKGYDALKVQFYHSRVVMKMGTSQTLQRKVIMWSWTANHAVAIITLTDYWWLHVPKPCQGRGSQYWMGKRPHDKSAEKIQNMQ